MLIVNNTKHVIVLKAFEKQRLFCKPGENNFDIKSADDYTKGNKAAQGYFDSGSLEVVTKTQEKAVQKAAEKKNLAIAEARKEVKEAQKALDSATKKEDKDAASIALGKANKKLSDLEA